VYCVAFFACHRDSSFGRNCVAFFYKQFRFQFINLLRCMDSKRRDSKKRSSSERPCSQPDVPIRAILTQKRSNEKPRKRQPD